MIFFNLNSKSSHKHEYQTFLKTINYLLVFGLKSSVLLVLFYLFCHGLSVCVSVCVVEKGSVKMLSSFSMGSVCKTSNISVIPWFAKGKCASCYLHERAYLVSSLNKISWRACTVQYIDFHFFFLCSLVRIYITSDLCPSGLFFSSFFIHGDTKKKKKRTEHE